MPHAPLSDFDHNVLDLIEHSPTGSVPRTPTYDESLVRLYAAQQVYHNSDHKNCHVTARSLARQPVFVAGGLMELASTPDDYSKLESNGAVFERYLSSLTPEQKDKAESLRVRVAGKPIHHRLKAGGTMVRDPLHSLFLIPGAGPQPGFPGNYLRGSVDEIEDQAHLTVWRVQIMDSDNDASVCILPTLADALEKLQELFDSVPFHLTELEALGFELH